METLGFNKAFLGPSASKVDIKLVHEYRQMVIKTFEYAVGKLAYQRPTPLHLLFAAQVCEAPFIIYVLLLATISKNKNQNHIYSLMKKCNRVRGLYNKKPLYHELTYLCSLFTKP